MFEDDVSNITTNGEMFSKSDSFIRSMSDSAHQARFYTKIFRVLSFLLSNLYFVSLSYTLTLMMKPYFQNARINSGISFNAPTSVKPALC